MDIVTLAKTKAGMSYKLTITAAVMGYAAHVSHAVHRLIETYDDSYDLAVLIQELNHSPHVKIERKYDE